MSDLTMEEYEAQLKAKYGDRRAAEFKAEWPVVKLYFTEVRERLSATYFIDRVLAVGGTGVVHVGHHKRFNQPVVIKMNRPLASGQPSMVENEALVLPTLSHPNVILVLDLGEGRELPKDVPKLTYIVEPFISGSRPFFTHDPDRIDDTWLYRRLQAVRNALPDSGVPLEDETGQAVAQIKDVLADFAALFAQWAGALSHLHEARSSAPSGYVYLDIKPENVLIDDHKHLTLIDYGSVERVDDSDPVSLEIFFTERYAHPDLIARKKQKPSSNRVVGGVKRLDLRHGHDYYALGASFLELLNEVAKLRPHVVPQLPLYRALHFLATRLLDGQNSTKDNHKHAPQIFPGLVDGDYDNLRYTNLADTVRDLEKERGRWDLAAKIPELATFSKDIVRLVPGFNTVLTARLRGVIEHPLVGRLKYITQLGLVSLVYPTADHARYDHALGSYTYTTYYVRSLFNDLGNPIFRNLVGEEDLNAVLLAALLHDLGQYPLAHDLEEVHERIFKHTLIGSELLEDSTIDRYGRTLRDILKDPKNGWGVSIDALRRIFRAKAKDLTTGNVEHIALKTEVLAAIVDGPVDADKADYIIRDSARCELPYGAQLDIERLLRVLTVAFLPQQGGRRKVTLGVYDKGLASAHAFGQARHQLLSTVYWHHTARVAKAMLQFATAAGLPDEVSGPPSDARDNAEAQIRERLVAFIKSLVPPFDEATLSLSAVERAKETAVDLGAVPPGVVLDALDLEANAKISNESNQTGWYPGIAWTDWLMLRWIATLPKANQRSRNLLAALQARRLYKRVETLARGGPHESLIRSLEELTWPERLALCDRLHHKVAARLKRDWYQLDTIRSLSASEFESLCESNYLMLVDIPSPGKKVGYSNPLGVVPELKEKSYRLDSSVAYEDLQWRELMERMIGGIAPVRILCHPAVRNLVSTSYANPKDPKDDLVEELKGCREGD